MCFFGDFGHHHKKYLEMKYPLFSWMMFNWDIYQPLLNLGLLEKNHGTSTRKPMDVAVRSQLEENLRNLITYGCTKTIQDPDEESSRVDLVFLTEP